MKIYLSAACNILREAFGGGKSVRTRGYFRAQPEAPQPERSQTGPHRTPSADPTPNPPPSSRPRPQPSPNVAPSGLSLRPPSPTRPHWGGIDLLSDDELLQFAVCGCTGSGKSLSVRGLLASVLRGMRADEDRRALIYDAKRDIYPFLHSLGLSELVINLNPFDRRGIAWDISRDIVTSAEIEQFASIIIPPNPQEHSPFFNDAARVLLRCTISALQAGKKGQWQLRDVIHIITNPERLRVHLEQYPETRDVAENFLNAKEFPSIMSTIETKIRPLQVVAALWHRSARRVSLREEWVNRGSIALIAGQPRYSAALDPINRAIFRFLSDEMLAKPNDTRRRSWVIMDEVREAGRLDGLRKLLTQGREKGICVVLGFQDIEGMRELYGREGANELIGQCNHKAFLRTDNPETAVWMQEHINKSLLTVHGTSIDTKDGKISVSTNSKIDYTVLASEFLEIPATDFQYGMKAFHLSSRLRKPYWSERSLREILDRLPAVSRDVPGEEPRPASDQELEPWSDADAARLGIVAAPRPPDPPRGTSRPDPSEGPLPTEFPDAEPPDPPPGSGRRAKGDPRAAADRLWASSGGRRKTKSARSSKGST